MSRYKMISVVWFLVFLSVSYASALDVVDATGKRVGTFVSLSADGPAAKAFVQINFGRSGPKVVLAVNRTRFFGFHRLSFDSTNCSGHPYYLIDSDASLFGNLPATIGPVDNVLFVPDVGGPQTTTLRSYFINGICVEDVRIAPAVPAVPFVDLDSIFTAPFEVR